MSEAENEAVQTGVLEDVKIEEEMSRDYIDYSMSVIVGRALPDVRDGCRRRPLKSHGQPARRSRRLWR